MKNIIVLILGLLCHTSFAQNNVFIGIQGGIYTFTTTYQNSMGQRLLDYDFAFNAGATITGGYAFDENHVIRGSFGSTPAGSKRLGGGLVQDSRLQFTSFTADYLYTPNWFIGNTHFYFGGGFGFHSLRNVSTTYFIKGKETDFMTYMDHRSPNEQREYFESYIENNGTPSNEDFFKSLDVRISGIAGIKTQLSDKLSINLEFISMFSLLDMNSKDWRLPRRVGEYKRSRNLIGGIQFGFVVNL